MRDWTKIKIGFGIFGLIALGLFALINLGVYFLGGTGWAMLSLGITGIFLLVYGLIYGLWFLMAKDTFDR